MTTDKVKLIEGKFIWCAISVYKIILRLFKAYISEFSIALCNSKRQHFIYGFDFFYKLCEYIFLYNVVNILFYLKKCVEF